MESTVSDTQGAINNRHREDDSRDDVSSGSWQDTDSNSDGIRDTHEGITQRSQLGK